MNNTPNSNRPHIVLYGKTNSGKSSIMNKILGQDLALVSDKPGTTTDPVQKAMELIPYGPVLFIDTAGICDFTELGKLREKKTLDMLKRTDLGIYVTDGSHEELKIFEEWKTNFKKYNIPYFLVINKIDLLSHEQLRLLKSKYEKAYFISQEEASGYEALKFDICNELKNSEENQAIVGDLVPYNGKVVMVVPVDSEAPKGRLILPQVQCIRDCLDHGIKTYVVRDTELAEAIKDLNNIDLVITDSQVFKQVDEIVPKNINLTSFSMLFARQKGNIADFIEGAKKIDELNVRSRVLICENCTHNVSHEDIGRVKIPALINKYVNENLTYDFIAGQDFPQDVNKYDLVIHCGGCMVNRKTVLNRINLCKENNVAITNYGIAIAFLTGILERAASIYKIK
ncbi:MAG: [FeFe] hydrogenase H-cluster maturation GTPase HydF [Clostridium sp.]|nr:[FeFe] hydrogenase H-cluster maturation GTPase HydF [Clostridium sp.]